MKLNSEIKRTVNNFIEKDKDIFFNEQEITIDSNWKYIRKIEARSGQKRHYLLANYQLFHLDLYDFLVRFEFTTVRSVSPLNIEIFGKGVKCDILSDSKGLVDRIHSGGALSIIQHQAWLPPKVQLIMKFNNDNGRVEIPNPRTTLTQIAKDKIPFGIVLKDRLNLPLEKTLQIQYGI